MFKRGAVEMAVTNRRVIIKTGLASRRSLEIMLAKVESIGVVEPTMGRILGYGTLTIHGTGGTPEPFSRIGTLRNFGARCSSKSTRSAIRRSFDSSCARRPGPNANFSMASRATRSGSF